MKLSKENIYSLFATFISLTVLLISLILFFNDYYSQFYFTLSSTCIFLITTINLIKKKCGLTVVYLIYFYLTHMSIPVIDLFTDPFYRTIFNTNWYYEFARVKAVSVSGIGLLIFSFVSNVLTIKKKTSLMTINIDKAGQNKLFTLGVILTIIFSLYFLLMIALGYINLTLTYSEFHENLVNVPLYGIFIFLFAVGMCLIFANATYANSRFISVLLLVPIALLFITGNRGEVLFPLAASAGVLITRGVSLNWKFIIYGLLIFFLVIPLVQEVRNLENTNELTDVRISPIDPFVTTGYTLRPVIYTVGWIESGETNGLGSSYAVPIQRGLSTVVPLMEPISYEGKPYSFRDRLPTMGYSVIAEAYYNFNVVGVISVMTIISMFLTLIGDRSSNFMKLSLVTVINAILINNIRNAFSFVPSQIAILLILVVVYLFLYKIIQKESIFIRMDKIATTKKSC